ncbi:MAG: hypothetical protein R6U26_01425 [Candidatus Undinarchaeales archaeon]
MDIIIGIIVMFYVAQTIDLLIRKLLGKGKKSTMFLLIPTILIPAALFGPKVFWFTFLFLAVYWSNVCRSSGYGLSYHLPLIIIAGVVYGSVGGFIVGFLPFMIIPYLMPDKKVIDYIVSSALLGGMGAVSGFFSAGNPLLIQFAISALIVYNLLRAALLYGKTPIHKITFYIVVNIAVNYFLIQNYLIQWIGTIT